MQGKCHLEAGEGQRLLHRFPLEFLCKTLLLPVKLPLSGQKYDTLLGQNFAMVDRGENFARVREQP